MRGRELPKDYSSRGLGGGILIGSVIGAGIAYVLYTDSGKKLCNTLSGVYQDLSEKVQDFTEEVAEKSESVRNQVSGHLFEKKFPSNNSIPFVIGGIAGGILGVSTVALLTSETTKNLRKNLSQNIQCLSEKTHQIGESIEEKTHDVVENFEDHVCAWISSAQKLIGNLSKTAKKESTKLKEEENSSFDNFLDWADLGIRLFQSLKK